MELQRAPLFLFIGLTSSALVPLVHAAEAPSVAEIDVTPATAASVRLDRLFSQLAQSKTPEDAKVVEDLIWDVWNRSGSISVDLLMDRALQALAAGNYEDSLTFLDEVVDLAPGYSEGWNKRATVHFLRDDYASALGDLEATLALEPRHFGAIAGLALVLEDLGDKEGALDAYRRVLAVYPFLEGAGEAESRLTVEIEGRGI
ncbi:MAG: hypothetical protein CMI60_00585 [Parvibaculum sp.]|jgi:tetratricopeptide (TPR) repeat protein|nr:hypothetical protein [Parvibaculum sp.]|tara:strand:- start:95 stop:700 length:606 start_codon:yes stop_codon:yes gene_type:complete